MSINRYSSCELLLTNTFTGKEELFVSSTDKQLKLYVCGITPYDYAHLGHGRCYVTFDILYRLLLFLGYNVIYCRNFTDIDDKLLVRAERELGDPLRYLELANKFIAAYHNDMKLLNCLNPTYEPRVTEHIGQIITLIEGLIENNHAYVIDGDVYFRVDSFDSYGKLSKRDKSDLKVGARVAVNEKKRDPLDFALWKGEKSGTFWPSPWGFGRPGWHIECSAMAREYLGDTIDIHGGGMDLIFPHHENERAQSEGFSGKEFVRFWVHNAFVRIDQEKMSKSLGNFLTLQDIFKQYHPMVLRYLFLQHQYRNPLDYSDQELTLAEKSYQKLAKLLHDGRVLTRQELEDIQDPEVIKILDRMFKYLLHDLNTPGLLGVVFEHYRDIQENNTLKNGVKTILSTILGLTLEPLPEKMVEITPEIQELLDKREEARRIKDWKTADLLRDELKKLGVEVQDKKSS